MIQSGGFLIDLLAAIPQVIFLTGKQVLERRFKKGVTLAKNAAPELSQKAMKSILTPLAKSILLPLGLSAGMSAADTTFQKKIYASGTTALIFKWRNGRYNEMS